MELTFTMLSSLCFLFHCVSGVAQASGERSLCGNMRGTKTLCFMQIQRCIHMAMQTDLCCNV